MRMPWGVEINVVAWEGAGAGERKSNFDRPMEDLAQDNRKAEGIGVVLGREGRQEDGGEERVREKVVVESQGSSENARRFSSSHALDQSSLNIDRTSQHQLKMTQDRQVSSIPSRPPPR